MAKRTKKKEDETKKVVAKCDHPNEVVANCNNPDEVIANCDNLQSLKFYPSLPYAYTEQGIGQSTSFVEDTILDFCLQRIIRATNTKHLSSRCAL